MEFFSVYFSTICRSGPTERNNNQSRAVLHSYRLFCCSSFISLNIKHFNGLWIWILKEKCKPRFVCDFMRADGDGHVYRKIVIMQMLAKSYDILNSLFCFVWTHYSDRWINSSLVFFISWVMAYFFLSQQTTEEILRKANIDFIPAICEFNR